MQRKPTMESLEKGYCIFCRTNKCDEQKLGQMYSSQSLVVHYFCLLFASGLSQNGSSDKEGIMGFLPHDIMKEVRRAARLKCTYCKGIGATIGCVMSKCRIVFHLPCGLENGAMNQFMGEFRSFCESHRPRQKMLSRDSEISESVAASICIICMSNISMRPSNTVLHMPCCKNSWFHRDCLQNHAVSSGLHFFRCPLCNDKDIFQKEMLKFGIYIPDQDAAWEREPNAFQDLLIRYSQCDVDCMCPHGREYERISSKWEVVLCDWCGSSGTHIACSRLKGPSDDWICKDCFQICGKDKTKGKKKADSCPKVVERPKSRPSIDHTPSNSKKRQRSKLDSFGEGRKSRKRSRLVTERKDVGRSVLQRRYSQVCDYTEDTEAETSGGSRVQTREIYARQVTSTRTVERYLEHHERCSRSLENCRFLSGPQVNSMYNETNSESHFAHQWMNEGQSNSENADQPDHLRFSDEAAAECRSHPSPTVPRWYRRLMSEDILTGKNLGVKYLEQYHELFGVSRCKLSS